MIFILQLQFLMNFLMIAAKLTILARLMKIA